MSNLFECARKTQLVMLNQLEFHPEAVDLEWVTESGSLRVESPASYFSLIGTSLSEPHTSVTVLHTRVCIYLWTDHLP